MQGHLLPHGDLGARELDGMGSVANCSEDAFEALWADAGGGK